MTAIIAFLTPLWNNPVVRKLLFWGGLALVAYVSVKTWKAGIEKGVRRQEQAAAEAQRQAQIASQTKETNERVEAYHEASAAVLSLPDDELRKRTEDDPNNRGLVPRG